VDHYRAKQPDCDLLGARSGRLASLAQRNGALPPATPTANRASGPEAVAAVRERVLDHLGREHFLTPGLPRYCAPTFSFGDRGQVVPRADPEVVCAQLLRVTWTVDHEDHAERVEFVLDPAPAGREQVLAEVERRVHARALLGSSAYGIARVETDGVVSINVTHESGYTTAAALKSGRHLCGGRVTPSGRPSSA